MEGCQTNSRWSRELEISKLMTYVYAFVCIYRNVSYAVLNRIEQKKNTTNWIFETAFVLLE